MMAKSSDPCPLRGTPHCQETAALYEVDPTQEPCRLQGELACRGEILNHYAGQIIEELMKPVLRFFDALAAGVASAWAAIDMAADWDDIAAAIVDTSESESWHARRRLKVRGRRRSKGG